MGLFYYAWPASQMSVCDQKCVNSWMVPRGTQSVVNFVLEIRWRLHITDAEPSFNF